MTTNYPNLVLTFLIEYSGSFLLVKRSPNELNFSNKWAFPGGKVEPGETISDTIQREVDEETGLAIHEEFSFLDSYSFVNSLGRHSVGLAVLVHAKNNNVKPNGIDNFTWVKSTEELDPLNRIPGIDNHFVAAKNLLSNPTPWRNLNEFKLSEEKYLNI